MMSQSSRGACVFLWLLILSALARGQTPETVLASVNGVPITQKQVDDSRNLIRARQEFINQQISYKRMRREVDSRIEKGLEGLQRLIDGLRENIIGDETIEKIELHPTVSDAIKYEASKVIDSEFFQSLRRQLDE